MIDETNDHNMEEMHYLMINVERMKKKMLGSVEGSEDPNLDYEAFRKLQKQNHEEAG